MTLKFGTWMIAVGAFLAFVGLCFPPAAFGTPRDPSVLPAGAMVFSTGMVLAAAGFYMKARYWAESETLRSYYQTLYDVNITYPQPTKGEAPRRK